MGTKTQAELIVAILEDLVVLSAGQSVAQEDADVIIRRLSPKVEELNAKDIAFISDLDAIDDAMFLPLVKIMAAEVCPAFGIKGADRDRLQKAAMMAEDVLRDVVANNGSMQMLGTEPAIWGMRPTIYGRF